MNLDFHDLDLQDILQADYRLDIYSNLEKPKKIRYQHLQKHISLQNCVELKRKKLYYITAVFN